MAELNIPEELHAAIVHLAAEEHISVEEYLKKALRTVRFIQKEWTPEKEEGCYSPDEDRTARTAERTLPPPFVATKSPITERIMPSHFVVIKSPHAQRILDGSKKFEYRPEMSARAIQNKTLAIAVAKNPRCPEAGKIIGQATFGRMTWEKGTMKIPVLSYELWEESQWVDSPGGLGVRPLTK